MPISPGRTSAEQLLRRLLQSLLSDSTDPEDECLWADDVVIEVHFAAGGAQRIKGRDQFVARAERGRAALPARFEEVRGVVVHQTVDPDVVIGEYELAGTITTTGKPASARFIGVLTAKDNKIVHWREYQDTLAMLTALGPSAT